MINAARRRAGIAVGAVLLAALSGCGRPSGDDSSGSSTPAALSGTTAPSPASESASNGAVPPPLDDGGPTDVGRAGRPDRESAADARTRAAAFLTAFARTDLPQQQWWDGVSGFFTPVGADAYTGTEVANVPVHKVVSGSARLVPDSTQFRAQVKVRTDAGVYTVVLVRDNEIWLVDRIVPPRSAG